jgi:tetratricopeptide (TPR) repeat protein
MPGLSRFPIALRDPPMSSAFPPTSRLYGLDRGTALQVAAAAQALEAGRVDEAERQLAAAHAGQPGHPEVLRLRAGILGQRGRHDEAIAASRQALLQRPDDPLQYNTFGTVLAEAGQYDDAIAALRRCCELQPGYAVAYYNLGVLLTRCVRHREATIALRRAVELDPRHSDARALLADMLRVGNQAVEAASEYRQILSTRPYTGMAWWGLADLKTTRFQTGDVAALRSALADPRASDDDRVAMGFALAQALDDENKLAESLQALADANAIARQRRRWDAPGFARWMESIRTAFDPAPASASGAIGGEVIFIASLPRSGSTLIEQILASHPRVEGAGELPDLPLVIAEESRRRQQPFPRWVPLLQPADWQRLGERYLERTSHWLRQRPHFTDKLPNNWFFLGAIRAMLPGARIILVRRDPVETCFSCYRQFLHNNEYSRTFADLAAYWREFDLAASTALALHPGHVLESVHEELIAAPEARIRALLACCGLEFDPACLDFHRTQRDVRSPSAMQVRQPLRADLGRAGRYGQLLDPLRAALRDASGPAQPEA